MPLFQYNARDPKGRKVSGKLEAADERQLVNLLREKDLSIVNIAEARERTQFKLFQKRAPISELVIFTRQMATMSAAGIPILQAIEVMEQQTDHRTFKGVLGNVRKNVAAGGGFSTALSKEGGVFSELFVSMVKAGEQGGSLDEIMERLATYLENTQRLIHKVKSAMIYPIMVILMAVAITLLLLTKVIPVFKQMYEDFDATLPGPTLVLIQISDFLITYFWVLTGAAVLFFFIFSQFVRTPAGRFWFDGFKLRLPIFGNIIRKLAISKFSRTLSTLIKSGVPILGALEIVGKSAGNRVVEKTVSGARISVRDGAPMSEPLKSSKVFPPLVIRMIAIGESTGELEKMLSKIADFYESETDAAIAGLTSILEPVIIAFLGVVVGGIVICMFLPIFSLSQIINV